MLALEGFWHRFGNDQYCGIFRSSKQIIHDYLVVLVMTSHEINVKIHGHWNWIFEIRGYIFEYIYGDGKGFKEEKEAKCFQMLTFMH